MTDPASHFDQLGGADGIGIYVGGTQAVSTDFTMPMSVIGRRISGSMTVARAALTASMLMVTATPYVAGA